MQEVWRCEGKNVFLQSNSVKRLKGEDYGTGKEIQQGWRMASF